MASMRSARSARDDAAKCALLALKERAEAQQAASGRPREFGSTAPHSRGAAGRQWPAEEMSMCPPPKIRRRATHDTHTHTHTICEVF